MVELDAEALAAHAVDPLRARTLLEASGFEAGSERTWVDAERDRRVLVRLLVFEGAGGAQTHMAWIRDHADELIGRSEPAAAPDAPDGAIVFLHGPSGCCPKETPAYLVPWRKGPIVVWLEVRGPRVGLDDVVDLALRLDTAV